MRPLRAKSRSTASPTTGEQPAPAATDLPDLSKHLEDRFGQRESPLLVALASIICFESIAVTGSVTASLIRNP